MRRTRFDRRDHHPGPSRFDWRNFAVGAVVSAILVGLLGDGTMIFFTAVTPREEGVNIGGAMLGGGSQPVPEGVGAGLAGFTIGIFSAGYLFFLARGAPVSALLEIPNMLPLLLPGVGAAFAGAALGNRQRSRRQPP